MRKKGVFFLCGKNEFVASSRPYCFAVICRRKHESHTPTHKVPILLFKYVALMFIFLYMPLKIIWSFIQQQKKNSHNNFLSAFFNVFLCTGFFLYLSLSFLLRHFCCWRCCFFRLCYLLTGLQFSEITHARILI